MVFLGKAPYKRKNKMSVDSQAQIPAKKALSTQAGLLHVDDDEQEQREIVESNSRQEFDIARDRDDENGPILDVGNSLDIFDDNDDDFNIFDL